MTEPTPEDYRKMIDQIKERIANTPDNNQALKLRRMQTEAENNMNNLILEA